MRLIAKTLYRAIPDLDPFTDDQCAHFMTAANRSWRRGLLRMLVIAVFSLLALAGSILLAAAITHVAEQRAHGWLGDLLAGMVGTVGIVLGMIGSLCLRDWMLVRRVRRLLRERGRCFSCNYSLLGARVDPDGCVTCPECGSRIQTDPAFNELATREGGGAVYEPVVPREPPEMVARRRRRRRRLLLWSGGSVAGVVLLLGLALALWTWFLEAQAGRARATRNGRQVLSALVREHQNAPPGAANRWREFSDLCVTLSERQGDMRLVKIDALPNAMPDFSLITYSGSPETYDSTARDKPGTYEASRMLTLQLMAVLQADGTIERLAALPSMSLLVRDMQIEGEEPLIGVLLPELGGARSIARLSTARMRIALWTEDDEGYIAALEQGLCVARAVERQGLLIDRLVATAIDSMLMGHVRNDAEGERRPGWREGVLRVLLERTARTPLTLSLDAEKQFALDTVRWVFSDPDRVRRTVLTGSFRDPDVGDLGRIRPFDTLDACERAIETVYAKHRAYAETPPWQRGALPGAGTDLPPLAQQLLPVLNRLYATDESRNAEVQSAILNVALGRYRDLHGTFPESLDALRGLVPPDMLIERWNGNPMAYQIVADERGSGGVVPALGVDAEIERERVKREAARAANQPK